jgi:hypothetical protein
VGDVRPLASGAQGVGGRPRIYARSADGRLRQGEILGNLQQSKITLESLRLFASSDIRSSAATAEIVVNFTDHPLVIVLTQDCDLDLDYSDRQSAGAGKLYDILVCDVYRADPFKQKLGKNMKEWKVIAENQSPRYQFLSNVTPDDDATGKGLPNLTMDFKRHFTLPTEEMYERLRLGITSRYCVLETPYVEHLMHRFLSFQGRVALPVDHPTDPG